MAVLVSRSAGLVCKAVLRAIPARALASQHTVCIQPGSFLQQNRLGKCGSARPTLCASKSKEADLSSSAAEDLESLTGDAMHDLRLTDNELENMDRKSLDGDDVAEIPKDMFKVSSSCKVTDVMDKDLVYCNPQDIIQDIVSKLSGRSGIPVVDYDRVVVGFMSRKDIMRMKKKHGSLKLSVADYMEAPVKTCPDTANAMEVAVTMLKQNVHRLPVVDAEQRLVGVASRSDLLSQLTGSEIESDSVKRIAADEDLMGSDYWKDLHMDEPGDLKYDDEEQTFPMRPTASRA